MVKDVIWVMTDVIDKTGEFILKKETLFSLHM